tara:strand:+ start:329 stop:1087 length:759 start_codon:yes stop_codon:yes gene_type:complete
MLSTMSKWYYGHYIDTTNNKIPFNDGTDQVATLNVGDYTLTEFVTEISRALNAASSLTFTVSVDRSTRLITIAAGSTFELQTTSGTAVNAFSLMGFSGADKTGADTYTGGAASGSEFKPQLKLQKYIDFGDEQIASYSNVAKSASGVVEVVSFGTDDFMTCEIAYQTNNNTTGSAIENQANGLDNLRTFLQYAVLKRKMEFIPDRDTPGTFTKTILESTNASGSGTGYRLNEYLGSLPGFFSSGTLKFRKMS